MPATEVRNPARPPKIRGPLPEEDAIYQAIVQGILDKRIRPGARLKEAALAVEHGVSRARIRRVLRRLADLSVVEFRLNIGAVVALPSPRHAQSAFRIRRLLEAEAVREAIARADAAALAALRRSIAEEDAAFRDRTPNLVALASRFHLLLAEATDNPVLARLLTQLVHQCSLIQALYEREAPETVCLVHEHVELVALMAQGRAEEAVALMAHHMDHIEESLDFPPPSALPAGGG